MPQFHNSLVRLLELNQLLITSLESLFFPQPCLQKVQNKAKKETILSLTIYYAVLFRCHYIALYPNGGFISLCLSIFRYGISFKTISGESNSVTEEMTAPWNETTLPTILSRYSLENIFNADEFGLFYNCLPDKTYHFKSEKCSGGKHSKLRLTGIAAGNAKGERLQMFIIGKSKNPRCFKGVKSLPCRYRSQQKSWMSSEIFEEWVKEIDRSFGKKKRKIALIVDNCPAHPHVEKLEWVELIFLPPNTTSKTQPMDQGVIRSLKAKYRKLAVQKHLEQLEEGKRTYQVFYFDRYDNA